jgi:hypothetical protein
MSCEIEDRVARIYAAIGVSQESDPRAFPAMVATTARSCVVHQDFRGGMDNADLANMAHGIIHNIANLEGHLYRWAPHNGRCGKDVSQAS